MNKKNIIIFNGSPRKNGTSFSFAREIKKLWGGEGNTAEIAHIIEYMDGIKDFNSLRNIILKSDVICLVTPLYVDTLPYPVIWFLEKLSREFKNELNGRDFFAIGQNGFPDPTLFEPLLGSCKCFAQAAGLNWLGGLGYCGGAIINGTPVENLGRRGRKITSAFKMAIEDITQGKMISPNVQERLTVRMPKMLYYPLSCFLNHKARKTAKSLGITNIERKVYLE